MGFTRAAGKNEGLRERKKRETLERIAMSGLRLFLTKGYEITTLDEIAVESGIARRTFFYYFKSKEEILMAFIGGGFVKSIGPAVLAQPTNQTPFSAVQNALLQLVSSYETEVAIKVDTLLSSTEALKARTQAAYIESETFVYEALCELWPEPELRESHKIIAMISIGAMRVAKETWRQEGGKMPLKNYLSESFSSLGVILSI